MQTQIQTYIRDKKNQRIGMLAARRDGNCIYIAHCKVNKSAGDKFDKSEALVRINERLDTSVQKGVSQSVPQSMAEAVDHFVARCYKYFRVVRNRRDFMIPELQSNTPVVAAG